MNVLLNEYRFHNGTIIGRISDNDMGLKKGRFIKVAYVKAYSDRAYCELGVKYTLGTKCAKSTAELFMDDVMSICCVTHDSNPLGKVACLLAEHGIAKTFPEPSKVNYKTCEVYTYTIKVAGRMIKFLLTCFKTTARYELHVCYQ
ncbi:hypothetical protein BOO92_15875 [Vibrio navarrensis]|uniref:hypothetical protein n=1 Tax=Vibrio TaxID=662 RepID=UPI0018670695|nr:hypothetical protein [Vibrio navarrensis]MBE3658158.1 hypothetical protein [Vibrio navarrensis]